MTEPQWWAHALGWGGAASLAVAAVLVAVLCWAPYAFLHDHPEDIREAAAEPSPQQRRRARIGGVVFMAALLLGLGSVVVAWGLRDAGAGFWELSAVAMVSIVLFMLVDLVIVDWLVICAWRPRAIVLPGTESCAGWGDYGFHARVLLGPGPLAVLIVGSGLLGGIAWLLTRS